MGVRGLTTFIKNEEKKFLKNFKLHNCKLLLDGNSVASNLFIWSNIESAFGGDYDKFANYVREFFKILKKCEISPLVVFDGGYERRKLKTVYSRLKDKYRCARYVQPFSHSLSFPLFMRIVFREVLTELNIPFAQSDFEADDELAALARQLKCPVLSNDSDFYIYDVLYIPLPSLILKATEFTNKNEGGCSPPKYYIDCKIYSVDVLIESFGGLDRSMLPLLAALLGNDYIKRSVFKAFYANLKIPKGKTRHIQRRIKAVIEWLRNETFESALKKIFGRMKKNSRRRVMRQLRKIVNGYIQCTSVLSEYLTVTDDADFSSPNNDSNKKILYTNDSTPVNIIDEIDKNIECISDDEEVCNKNKFDNDLHVIDDEISSSSSSCENPDCDDHVEEDTLEVKNDFHKDQSEHVFCEGDGVIPKWLLICARKGKIQSCVIDILSLKQYFCPPQVEDYSCSPSHLISLNILSTVVGILLGKTDILVKYWIRNGTHLEWYIIEPIYETVNLKFPQCDSILEVSESLRKMALLEAANISIELSLFPEEWQIFIVAILFWLKLMKEPVATESHLHTMVMCLVGIYAIDSQIGVHRNKNTFTRKYKHFFNKVMDSRSKEKLALKESKESFTRVQQNKDKEPTFIPLKDLQNITREDCVLMFETILPYHHLSEQLKAKPKLFCLKTVHAFAQFQSCLFQLMVLNSVLGFPLQDVCVSRFYSGTFAYNIYQKLSKCNNISVYIENLFQSSPSLLNLYRSLIHLLKGSLSEVCLQQKTAKTNKKKKRQNHKTIIENIAIKISEDMEETDIFFDENNIFSRLSLNALS